jgi:hypothetical protein
VQVFVLVVVTRGSKKENFGYNACGVGGYLNTPEIRIQKSLFRLLIGR